MGWNWWQGVCEHNLHLRIPSPHPKNLISELLCFGDFVFFTCFGTQNHFFIILLRKSLTGVRQIDADWKVSAFKMKINLGLWTDSSKSEFKHVLTTKSWIWGLWVFSDFSNPSFAWGTWAWEAGGTNGEIPGEPGRPVPSARSLRRRVRTL